MIHFSYQDAKTIIHAINNEAAEGRFATRGQFHAFLDNNPHIPVQGYNAYGKVFFWNPASVAIYGYREKEAVNQDICNLIIPEEMRPLVKTCLQAALQNGKIMDPSSSCELLRKNGEFVTVYSGHLLFWWDGDSTPEFYRLDLALETARFTAP